MCRRSRSRWRPSSLSGACAGPGAEGRDSGGALEVFKIGFTGTLSGEFASYAVEMRQGVELAVDEINAEGGMGGVRTEVVVADDRGEPSQGRVIAQRFCDDEGIKVVLGYSFSSGPWPPSPPTAAADCRSSAPRSRAPTSRVRALTRADREAGAR